MRELTRQAAGAALRAAGFNIDDDGFTLEKRGDRWLARLADEVHAWFPASDEAQQFLANECRVLDLIAQRCDFAVPQVLFAGTDGLQVRRGVLGLVDPWGIAERAKTDGRFARDLGATFGGILAQQHSRISSADVGDWLPTTVRWPEPRGWIMERLPSVIDNAALMRDIVAVLDLYEAAPVAAADRVLVHGDVGFHNLAFDRKTHAVTGMFDYDSAVWADRHHDFRYLMFDPGDFSVLDAAIAVYEPAVGRRLDRARISLYNAAAAISFLAFRKGFAPHDKPAGRTLEQDLDWTQYAVGAVLGSMR